MGGGYQKRHRIKKVVRERSVGENDRAPGDVCEGTYGVRGKIGRHVHQERDGFILTRSRAWFRYGVVA